MIKIPSVVRTNVQYVFVRRWLGSILKEINWFYFLFLSWSILLYDMRWFVLDDNNELHYGLLQILKSLCLEKHLFLARTFLTSNFNLLLLLLLLFWSITRYLITIKIRIVPNRKWYFGTLNCSDCTRVRTLSRTLIWLHDLIWVCGLMIPTTRETTIAFFSLCDVHLWLSV